ncbi:IpaD/SipD/SspD family type III secretion system needle tip protein [Escherichia coli]|nr:IpaD/SipD/SspD family type III secretion system needle tip protein [Escherichia coli]
MFVVRIDISPVMSILYDITALFYPNADESDLFSVLNILERHNVDIYDNDAVAEALKNGDIKKEIEETTGIKDYNDLYFSSAEYQAFQAGFDAQEQIIQTTMQTMTQKYNTAVSLVDNLYKILSSTISSCTETLKAYLTY